MRSSAAILLPVALICSAAAATPCVPGQGREARHLTGEVTAGERFAEPVGLGWTFELDPDAWGWVIRLRAPGGDDLARITPPFHFVPNPRDLHGWHFRNRANTGPNVGDVNAPQETRGFIFDREIPPGWPDPTRVEKADGRGALEIVDFSLSPPEPGARAHFTRLSFDACLTWPTAWKDR